MAASLSPASKNHERTMTVGVQLGHIGSTANAEGLLASATAFEQAGYESIWVLDRLLVPVAPRTAYPGNAKQELGSDYSRVLDPIVALGAAAAVTSRIRIGTSILVAPWYRPVMLARALSTLDVISNGRLTVGLGLGWSADEYEAAGVPQSQLGPRLDEMIEVLRLMWGPDPVACVGDGFAVAPSSTGSKPVQPGGPPILLAAYSPAGLDRVARTADGWNPAGLPVEALGQMWPYILGLAETYGRDPSSLKLVVRANLDVCAQPIKGERPSYTGNIDQIADDLHRTAEVGAHEVTLGCFDGQTLNEVLDIYGRLASVLGLSVSP